MVEWLTMNGPRPASDSDVLSRDEPVDDDEGLDDIDRIEASGDIVSVPEIDENQRLDQVCPFD